MRIKKNVVTGLAIMAIIVIAALRLVSNKHSFEDQLRMSSGFNTTIPVIVDTVKYENVIPDITVNGSFAPFREITIVSETQGKVVSITAETGDAVRAGQTLACIENELYASRFDLAKYNLEKAKNDLARYEQLSKGDAVTLQQYESTKLACMNAQSDYTSAQMQLDNSFIRSPFDGIITKKHIEKGDYMVPGASVFELVEISKVKFMAELTSHEMDMVYKGQPVKISMDEYPGFSYDGIVSSIVVTADQSRRYTVESVVINRNEKPIKPGMYGTARFVARTGMQVLVIPRKAVSGSIKNPEVFVVSGDSVVLRSIHAIPLNDETLAVSKGLNEGDAIVVSGQINLVTGTRINVNKK
jgi:membrane fusion protein, multidrug efflux system